DAHLQPTADQALPPTPAHPTSGDALRPTPTTADAPTTVYPPTRGRITQSSVDPRTQPTH
uniref:Uncharacterized protein n=1 Tax=Cucumis melo TaxID=3656 RepID=A0A9I9E3F3_CUCME